MTISTQVDLAPIGTALAIASALAETYERIYGVQPPMPDTCTEYHQDPHGVVCEPSAELLDMIHYLDRKVR